MSGLPKAKRGKTLVGTPGRSRGTCPVCGRTGVKLLWKQAQDGDSVDVCKRCRNAKSA